MSLENQAIKCDNPNCNYVYSGDTNTDPFEWVGKRCPKCNDDLMTANAAFNGWALRVANELHDPKIPECTRYLIDALQAIAEAQSVIEAIQQSRPGTTASVRFDTEHRIKIEKYIIKEETEK